ncbi:CHC2 zinc finger domain-containing protein [Prosthecobacter sp.]|uniref:CHC2 zinc finger domain-containing protein n=1 Tax=Prosthecobacter sp. TaxID=1965333 RepID=UPI0037840265
MKKHDIPALKERLLIPEVWQMLGLQGVPAKRCRSPLREDRKPSFSIYNGGRMWKDHSTGEGGDVIDFIATAKQLDIKKALKLFLDLAGVPLEAPSSRPAKTKSAQAPAAPAPRTPAAPHAPARSGTFHVPHPAPAHPPTTPTDSPTAPTASPEHMAQAVAAVPPVQPEGIHVPLQHGTENDRQLVAESRHITPEAVSLALALRTLTFAIVKGFRCWVIVDAEGRIAEARRLDGQPFPECGTLGSRKAHTLRGSRKNWPVGAAVLRRVPSFKTLLLVEGGPDYLAALHFAHELERWDVLPVAMLGRSAGTRMDAEALKLMRGRRVRIYPHADADGGGVQSARVWAAQLHGAGCTVDIYEFTDLHRTDGKPIKDLNDCTAGLDEASMLKLRESLMPKPDLEVDPPY